MSVFGSAESCKGMNKGILNLKGVLMCSSQLVINGTSGVDPTEQLRFPIGHHIKLTTVNL